MSGVVDATWDAQLLRFTDQNLYQSARWGRYKRVRGWTPQYFHAEADGQIVGMLQALVRTHPWRTVIAWCPGGPVGAPQACSRESMTQLSSLLDARTLYCRSSFLRARTPEDDEYLRVNGWSRPTRRVGADTTAVWNLDQTEEQILAGLNRNWRYSLRQAQKNGDLAIERLCAPPIPEIAELCASMNRAKGLTAPIRESEVAALFDALGERAVAYGCRNRSGNLIALHSCGIQGSRAWELIAATSEEGRRAGASFAVLWALVLHCRRLEVTHYDLAGIDPENVPGVTSFKRWTGAEDVERLGEWEWSTSSMLRRAVNFAVPKRADTALP